MAAGSERRGNMLLIYSHRDADFLTRSKFMDFLEALASELKLEFWWDRRMSRSQFDDEICERLAAADIVLCLVSQSFINSKYVTEVEAKIIWQRLVKEGIIVVPIMLEDSTWDQHDWLRRVHHVPGTGYIIPDYNNRRARVFKEIVDHIRTRVTGLKTPYREPRTLYTLRRLPDSDFRPVESSRLVEDSKVRAARFVSDAQLRSLICRTARQMRARSGGKPLGKRQLEELDRRFLARGRKPDAMRVRWVLRACGQHPQGRFAQV